MARPYKRVRRKRCRICRTNATIDYKDTEYLKQFTNASGQIVSGGRTGNCSKHQRDISRAIKRARMLALLPYSK